MNALPVLYSYRRCPYAMRARMALFMAKINVEVREISFKNKPAEMLAASPKGTVPVLVLTNGKVLEESIDIVHWALTPQLCPLHQALISQNDGEFKKYLDRYKYPSRFPQENQNPVFWRTQALPFLEKLEELLAAHPYLNGEKLGVVDISIMPFVRQFSKVDEAWWQTTPFPHTQKWLKNMVEAPLFTSVMKKRATWQSGDDAECLIPN